MKCLICGNQTATGFCDEKCAAAYGERERIIKLIEQNFEEKVCSCAWDGEYDNCFEGEFEDEAITKVIALIKGEK